MNVQVGYSRFGRRTKNVLRKRELNDLFPSMLKLFRVDHVSPLDWSIFHGNIVTIGSCGCDTHI